MSKIRTIRETMKIIKTEDPDTCITEYMLRKMVANNQIKAYKVGNKYLIDIDLLFTTNSQQIEHTAKRTP